MNNTDWLDIIPAVPLARGVPVTFDESGRKGKGIALSVNTFIYDDEAPNYDTARVDLGDPQGFAYGLQLLAQGVGRSAGDDYGDIIMRSLWGNTTDEDRAVLAKALKEVTND